jgi:hypothetical protein
MHGLDLYRQTGVGCAVISGAGSWSGFAWMQWHRRLLTRWEYYPRNFLGFVQLAAMCILLKQF